MNQETYRAAIAELDRTAHVDVLYSEHVAARENWASITQPGLIAGLLDAIQAAEEDAALYKDALDHLHEREFFTTTDLEEALDVARKGQA